MTTLPVTSASAGGLSQPDRNIATIKGIIANGRGLSRPAPWAPARRWADSLAAELIAGASQRPLLSGYYRVAAALLSLAEEGGMFLGGGEGAKAGGAAPEGPPAQVPLCALPRDS